MSKVFITKNGQFVSRGEGVLTRIENPDLEVNDIGVEVSERIAEDVKEGELVFQHWAGFDDYRNPGGIYRATSMKFVETIDGLFCVMWGRDATSYQIQLFKYIDGTWQAVVGPYHLISTDSRNANSGTGSTIALSDGRIVFVSTHHSLDNIQTIKFNIYEGNIRKHIPLYPLSGTGESGPLTYLDGTNARPYEDTDIIEYNGEIHAVGVCQQNYTTSDLGMRFYKVDVDNYKATYVPVEPDPNNPTFTNDILACDLVEYNGELLCVTDRVFYRYNSSTSSWDYGGPISSGQSTVKCLVTSSNELYVVGTHYSTTVNKYNTSTSSFDSVFGGTLSGTWGSSLIRSTSYIENGSIYMAGCPGYINSSSSSMGDFYRFDFDTSSFEYLGSIEYKKGKSTGDVCWDLDSIYYNGERHFVTANFEGERYTFFKLNEDLDIKRNTRWSSLPAAYSTTTDAIEYNGTTYAWFGDRTVHHQIGIYNASSDSFDPFGTPDTFKRVEDVNLFELSGNLYCIHTSDQSPYLFMYQFDTSANQFYKLADHSESLASYLHAMDSIEYEGKRFISCSYNASPYLKTFVFDGSSVSSLPDTPTQAITSTDQANSGKFFIDNDQLFLVQANQDNLVSSTPSFDTYKYNGSGWDEVSAGDWQNYTPSSNNLEWLYTVSSGDYINSNLFGRCYSLQPFNVSGVTYLFARYYGGSVGWQNMRILEYVDGSGWFYREDISPGYAGMATTRSGMSAKEVNGNWYFYCHSNIILIRKPGWVWESIRTVGGATTYQSGYTKMSSLNNKPVLFLSLGTNKQHQRYTVSDYANQRVWYKRPITNNGTNGDSGPNDTVAYGIALQDGSKGDIIKIRRIKQ